MCRDSTASVCRLTLRDRSLPRGATPARSLPRQRHVLDVRPKRLQVTRVEDDLGSAQVVTKHDTDARCADDTFNYYIEM